MSQPIECSWCGESHDESIKCAQCEDCSQKVHPLELYGYKCEECKFDNVDADVDQDAYWAHVDRQIDEWKEKRWGA
jgi:hypothetical protein